MKPNHILLLLLTIAIATLISSCDKESHNGRLDGMWQFMEVTTTDTSGGAVQTDASPYKAYLLIQLDLAQIRTGGAPVDLRGAHSVVCRFDHSGGHLRLYNFHRHFRDADSLFTDADTVILRPLGISGEETLFDVVRLTSNTLELSNQTAHIRLRKF